MNKEKSGNAREIINQWMQIAIWIVALMVFVYVLWIDPKVSLQSTLLNVSTLLPLFLLIATLLIEIGGYTVRGFILAKEALRDRRERIRQEKIAAAMAPLVWRVVTRFVDEHDADLMEKSDTDLLEMVKAYGANKTFDVATEHVDENILEFLYGIDHNKRDNLLVVKVSDLMGNDDFANEVVSLVKKNQYMHIE